MKKLFLSLLVISSFFQYACVDDNCKQGSGNISTQERKLDEFKGVRLKGSSKVIITRADTQKVTINTDDNLLNSLSTVVSGNDLIIDFSENTCPTYAEVQIRLPRLNRIYLDGSGDIVCDSIIITEDCLMRLSGSGNILVSYLNPLSLNVDLSGSGNINFSELMALNIATALSGSGNILINKMKTHSSSAILSGSGNITFYGTDKNSSFVLSGSGKIDCLGCISDTANTVLSGSGNIYTSVLHQLSAELTGSGNIYYKGSPDLKKVLVTGSGKLIKL